MTALQSKHFGSENRSEISGEVSDSKASRTEGVYPHACRISHTKICTPAGGHGFRVNRYSEKTSGRQQGVQL